MLNDLIRETTRRPLQAGLLALSVLLALARLTPAPWAADASVVGLSLSVIVALVAMLRASRRVTGQERWGWGIAAGGFVFLAILIPMTFIQTQHWEVPFWWHLDLMHFIWLAATSLALLLLTTDSWLDTWRYSTEYATISGGLSMFIWLTPYGQAFERHSTFAALVKTFQAASIILICVVIFFHQRHKETRTRVPLLSTGTFIAVLCSAAIAVIWTIRSHAQPTALFLAFQVAMTLVWLSAVSSQPYDGPANPPMRPLPVSNLMLIIGMAVLMVPVIHGNFAQVAIAQVLWLAVVVAIRNQLNNRVYRNLVERLTAREAQLEYEAYHDSLTGLDNRTNFMRELESRLNCETMDPLAVVFADVDNFKEINDRFGHIAGDTVLKRIADHLRALGPEVVATARLSGDEFASIVMPPEHAPKVAQQIVSVLRTPIEVGDRRIVATASVGVVEVDPAEELTSEEVITRADLAMYSVKKHGRDDFAMYTIDVDDSALDDRLLAPFLADAIMNDMIQVHYQPIFDMATGDLAGFEALARWTHQGKPVPANRFVALAERTGLIRRLTDSVIDTVCRDLAGWKDINPEVLLEVGVNISGINLGDADMLERIVTVIAEHGVQSKQLTLEVTETMPIPDAALAADLLTTAREFGFHVALDDFGTGTNSISHLLQLPLNRVKIDPTMVRGLEVDSARSDLVEAMISLSQNRDLLVVVEGVETEAEARVLHRLGADRVQGYYYGRPMPANYWDDAVRSSRPVKSAGGGKPSKRSIIPIWGGN